MSDTYSARLQNWLFPVWQINSGILERKSSQSSEAFIVKPYTAALQPEHWIIAWLCLRYKHRWSSKRHVPRVTMQTREHIWLHVDNVSTFFAKKSLHLCTGVSLWDHLLGCLPLPTPKTKLIPISCVGLMIKAPATPLLLLMLWHNGDSWGLGYFIHSIP